MFLGEAKTALLFLSFHSFSHALASRSTVAARIIDFLLVPAGTGIRGISVVLGAVGAIGG